MQKALGFLFLSQSILSTGSQAVVTRDNGDPQSTSSVAITEVKKCLPEKHLFDPYRHKKTYRVGIHANNGFEAAVTEYNLTFAEYLTQTAGNRFNPPIKFELVPYLFDELFEGIYAKEVDLFFANPGIYSCIAAEVGASALATVVTRLDVHEEEHDLDVYAGVIFTREDNKEINSVTDLKDKIIAAGATSQIGGGQMQLYEMQKAGLSYVNDPKQVVFTHNLGDIVIGVMDGIFDVGFVRTGSIEATRNVDGKFVDPDLFKIIDPKLYVMDSGEVFPYLHSTDVIPEYPLSATPSVPTDVQMEVQEALLALRQHIFVGQKLQECRTTSSLKNCQVMANETYSQCAQSSLNITVCQVMADQKLSHCKENLHAYDCEALSFPFDFDPDARCDTTKAVAEIAFAASKAGGYAGFSPSPGYFDIRTMQQAAGFMKQNDEGEWYCPRLSNLYEGIDCPETYYKRSYEEFTEGCDVAGLECDTEKGYDCFCKPCVHANEVDVYEYVDGEVDSHVVQFNGAQTEGCAKMSICGTAVQGQTILMRAYDNLEREGATVEVVAHFGDSKMELKVTRVPGTFAYEFSLNSNKVEVRVIEISVNGEQIPESPIRIMIRPVDCDAIYGQDSHRSPTEDGQCECANNTYEIGGSCIESQFFFLIIFSAVVLFLGICVFAYLSYRKNQNDTVWHINVDELHFNEPPEVIGQGGFGVVILGQYRGTKVAVKRVIPPERSGRYRKGSIHSTDSVEDPLHSCPASTSMQIEDSKKPSVSKKACSSDGKKTAKYESHSQSKEVKFRPCNMTGEVEHPPLRSAESTNSKESMTMSNNKSWEELLRPNRFNNVLKILESATLSSHGSLEIAHSFTSNRGVISRCIPDFLRFDEHSKLRREFVVEMRLLSRLRHPCITTVMGAVISSNVDPMLVMEYMEYGSLYDLLHNETMYTGGEILLQIIRDIVQGIHFLHASKPPILHGDLKAKNILVDSRFRAKVADFGFSHFKDKTKASVLQGTPFFMAPEYLTRRSEYDSACDIYSLSMILYEIYARKDPFEGEDPRKILPKICHPRVNKRPPVPDACPPKIADIMKKCWSANPFFRPSAKDLDYILVEMSSIEAEPLVKDHNKFKEGMTSKPTSLYDVFPKHIADALNAGQRVEPEAHEIVTVVFSEIVGFATISQTFSPLKVSNMLDRLYQSLDALTGKHNVFKVETIGDAYMGVTNLDGTQFDTHVKQIAEFAIDAIEAANQILIDEECPEGGTIQIRVGFHSGPVVSNVIGSLNPRYGLFGDTVNTASRMESNSVAGQILCTYASAKLLETQAPDIEATLRGKIQVKGKGKMITYWIGRKGQNVSTLERIESFSESPSDTYALEEPAAQVSHDIELGNQLEAVSGTSVSSHEENEDAMHGRQDTHDKHGTIIPEFPDMV